MKPGKADSVEALINAALRGELDEAQARQLYGYGPEIVVPALLAASKHIAGLQTQATDQQPSPSTPSGMVPIHTKPNTPKRRKKPGAKKGHPGHRRAKPKKIDHHRTHRLKRCPHCNGQLQ